MGSNPTPSANFPQVSSFPDSSTRAALQHVSSPLNFIRAGRAVRDTENLRRKVAALEFELRHLTRERHPPTPSPEATTHEPSVPAETTDEARTDLPEFLTPVPPQYADVIRQFRVHV